MSGPGRGRRGKALGRKPGTQVSGAPDERDGGLSSPADVEGTDVAFDHWLEDRLRNAYSSVLDEPIPDDLLRLLQQKLKD